jgi:hypothetical protein
LLGAEPRQVSEAERAALQDMAAMVMAQIELRHAFGRVDPLSGLPNRNQFLDDFGDLALDRPRGEERLAALISCRSSSRPRWCARRPRGCWRWRCASWRPGVPKEWRCRLR